MNTKVKRPITPSTQGTPKEQINRSSNSNNISQISHKSSVSAYLDRKHHNTKEKIDNMRTEAYNKLMAEVKTKPTISSNSQKIINQLIKKRNSHNQSNANEPIISKSLHRDNTDNHSSKQQINTSNYTTNTSISQVEQYKSIFQSRERRIKEINKEKKRKAQSVILIPKTKSQIVITEVIHCQRDKLFNQEYFPYNEKAVFNIRSKLQKYYDCKTEYKHIPFNQQPGTKKDKSSMMTMKAKENPIIVIRNSEAEEIKQIINRPPSKHSVLSSNVAISTNASGINRRERDVQLLLEFTKGLGQGSNLENTIIDKKTNANNNNKEKVVRLPRQVIIQNNNTQGNQLLKINTEVTKENKHLNPSEKLFIEERMRMIKTNFQLQEPPC